MKSKKINSLIKYEASDLDIKFPDNEHLALEEKHRTQNSILKGGVVKPDNRCYISKESTKIQLCTDTKGANRFYNNLDNEDKFEDGKNKYASISAVTKEISERIQEPRDPLTHEKLKYNEECLKSFRDHPKLEQSRHIEDKRIQNKLPKLTKEKMKSENIGNCQLTGETFDNDAEGHHIERKADNPRKACDTKNIVVVKGNVHDTIHAENAEDRESLKKLCDNKGWNKENL